MIHFFESHLLLVVVAVWFLGVGVWYACDLDGGR